MGGKAIDAATNQRLDESRALLSLYQVLMTTLTLLHSSKDSNFGLQWFWQGCAVVVYV